VAEAAAAAAAAKGKWKIENCELHFPRKIESCQRA